MDRRERFAEMEEMLRLAMQANRAGLWTCLPGIIQSFNTDDPDNVTAVVQPSIRGVVQSPAGGYQAVDLPVLPDVPVVFPRGGGCTLTFPIKAGDECLVIFSSRCIDGWWQSGGVQLPMEPRMHDLSDGFAILGPQSNPTKISAISTDAVQLRSDDGQAFIQLNPETHQIDTITPGKITAQAGGDIDATAAGNVSVTVGGNFTADVTGSGTITTGGNLSASSSGNVTVEASGTLHATSGGAMTLAAPTVTINAPAITLNGAIALNGTITQGAGGGGGGTTAHLIGPLTVDNNVTAQGTSVHTHTHSGVSTGPSNTGGPN